MPSAICPYCHEPAFSSAEFDQPWTCPTCGRAVVPDIAERRKQPGGFRESVVEKYSRMWIMESPKKKTEKRNDEVDPVSST